MKAAEPGYKEPQALRAEGYTVESSVLSSGVSFPGLQVQ